VIEVLAAFLRDELAEDAVAGFVYGSVAHGRAGPGSDIDFFVVTRRPLAPARRDAVGRSFAALQRSLGFTPDPQHPVELFSDVECRAALDGSVLDRALAGIAETGSLDPVVAEHDDVEVLRALLDRRVVVLPNPRLELLTERAAALAARPAVSRSRLLRALGLSDPDGRGGARRGLALIV
jgi:Nucleotidyltransferase domain